MNAIPVPQLFYPFAPAQHPDIERFEQESVERWAKKLGLHSKHQGFKKLRHSRFAVLLGRCHPEAAKEELELIVDFAVWLFLWDDQFDNRVDEQLARPEWIRQQNMLARDILRGATPEVDAAPLLWILADIRERLSARMPSEWLQRFIGHCEEYFEGTVWESETRQAGIHPDVQSYVLMRRMTSGVHMVVDLIELAEGIHLPEAVLAHKSIQQMITATNDVVAWSNDIFSLASDMQDVGHLNLVLSLREHVHPELEDAVASAAKMHDAEVSRFVKLAQGLPSFGEHDAAVARFVRGLGLWMRANYDWSILTGRYTEPEAAPSVDMGRRPLVLSA